MMPAAPFHRRAFVWLAFAGTLWIVGSVLAQPATSQPTSRPETHYRLSVAVDELNVRSRPDANSLVVTRVARGALLEADGLEYGWYRVVPPAGTFCLVSSEYVDRRAPERGVASLQSGSLRVRWGSTVVDVNPLQSEAVALLASGTPVEILGEQEGWLKIVPPVEVRCYVAVEHVVRVDAPNEGPTDGRIAGRLEPTSRPAVTTQPSEPALTGVWGGRLAAVEARIREVAAHPPAERAWPPLITELKPIAEQREQPSVARLAAAWIADLSRRHEQQAALAAAEELLRKNAREEARHARELERIDALRRQAATQPAITARGALLRSYALQGVAPANERSSTTSDENRWFKLQDPLTQKIEVYVEVPAQSSLDLTPYLGRYIGVRGSRRPEPRLGADVVTIEAVVELDAPATTRPASAAP